MSYNQPPPIPGYPQNPMGGIPAKPDNYLVWSILVTLFCCLPFGIVAIVQSTKVDSLYTTGQFAAAEQASAAAKKWNIIAVVSAGIGITLYLLLIVALAVFGETTTVTP